MIEYYTSTFNPDCYFAAVDGVVVAMFHQDRWIDRCIYRPVRNHYTKTNWQGVPYDPTTLVNPFEFEFVKANKREFPLDKEREELARLKAKL